MLTTIKTISQTHDCGSFIAFNNCSNKKGKAVARPPHQSKVFGEVNIRIFGVCRTW